MGCEITWKHGSSSVRDKLRADIVFTLSGRPCDTLEPMAETIMSAADSVPAEPAARPQRPLTYRPNDVDDGEPGACVDFNGDIGCAPYAQVGVPQGGLGPIVEAAGQDPNVFCAAAADAVSKRRRDMRPVTFSGQCFFVEPTHSIQLSVHVFRDPPGMGAASPVCGDSAEVDLAGTAGFVCADTDMAKHSVYLSPADDIQQPGALALTATLLPPRGDLDADPTWEQAKVDVVQKIAEDIARDHA